MNNDHICKQRLEIISKATEPVVVGSSSNEHQSEHDAERAESYQAPTDALLQPELTVTMDAFATLTQENADPMFLDKHQLPAYAGQKAVLLLFVPYAHTVLEYAKQRFDFATNSLIPSPVIDFYGEFSRLFEMGLTYTVEEWTTVFIQTLQKAARHDSLARMLNLRHSRLCAHRDWPVALRSVLKKFSQGRIHQQEPPSVIASPEYSVISSNSSEGLTLFEQERLLLKSVIHKEQIRSALLHVNSSGEMSRIRREEFTVLSG